MTDMNGRVTIFRNSSDEVHINIKDSDSRQNVSIKLDLQSYAMLITGLSEVEGNLTLPSDPSKLGKERISMRVRVMMPNSERDDALAYQLCCRKAGPGWEVNKYFVSQSSFGRDDEGNYYAQTTAHKWVEKTENKGV